MSTVALALALLLAGSAPDTVLWHAGGETTDVTACAGALPELAVRWAAEASSPISVIVTERQVEAWKEAGAFEIRYREPHRGSARFAAFAVRRILLPAAGAASDLVGYRHLTLVLGTDGEFGTPPLAIEPDEAALAAILACRL